MSNIELVYTLYIPCPRRRGFCNVLLVDDTFRPVFFAVWARTEPLCELRFFFCSSVWELLDRRGGCKPRLEPAALLLESCHSLESSCMAGLPPPSYVVSVACMSMDVTVLPGTLRVVSGIAGKHKNRTIESSIRKSLRCQPGVSNPRCPCACIAPLEKCAAAPALLVDSLSRASRSE